MVPGYGIIFNQNLKDARKSENRKNIENTTISPRIQGEMRKCRQSNTKIRKTKIFWHKQPLELDSLDNFALEKVWLK